MLSKNRRCAYCKKKVPTETAKINGLKAFCSTDHALAWLNTEKGAITLKKAQKARDKEALAKLKTKGQWRKEAQAAVNAYIRWRDRDDPCISCGKHKPQRAGGIYDAGHYIDRGTSATKSGSFLKFNVFNIHKQCVTCNRYHASSCKPEYRKNLIAKIGLERVLWLESAKGEVNDTIEYYKRVKTVFQKRLRIKKKIVDARNNNN